MAVGAQVKTVDPDQFRVAIRPANGRFTIIGRGQFSIQATQVTFDDLRLQRGDESVAREWHLCVPSNRLALTFVFTGAGLGLHGVRADGDAVLVGPPGLDAMHTLFGPTVWGSVTLPPDRLAEYSVALTGRDWTPPGNVLGLKPGPAPLARLLRLHASMTHLAETAPALLAHPDVARGLEQSGIEAFVACLEQADYRVGGEPFRKRTQVMKRFRGLVERHADQGLFLSEVCAAVGVPYRTLNLYCREEFGVSPKQYLLLRRLHLVRHALRQPGAGRQTVTEAAMRFGFWELGRFAAFYQAVFGERPSATLRASLGR